MKVGILNSKSAEVNGTKTKSLRTSPEMPQRQQKEPSKETFLTQLPKSFMGVLSDDFATVDVREELCYHSLTEKANSEEIILLLECKKLT